MPRRRINGENRTGRHASGKTDQTAEHTKVIRCAIYTRKSTSQGLDQAFNSLDAQRESCEAYIASQKALGWQARPDRYDDGGFTGGNIERPAIGRAVLSVCTLLLVLGMWSQLANNLRMAAACTE